ncbi:MAG: hypothetical protein FWH26_06310 [Oscillospiraceae bacterium]|nr:hypothetical protein [Oscillospiraceae bacterium]
MIESIKTYPWLVAAFFVVLAGCVFLWYKAVKTSGRRNRERQALIARLEYENKLRADFASPTQRQLADTPPEQLVEGLCCHIQMALEKESGLNEAFAALPQPKRWLYALGYVAQDCRKGLEHFFRANGKPLTPVALEAVEALVGGEFAALFRLAYEAFDEENETRSLLKEDLVKWESAFRAVLEEQGEALYAQAREYALRHADLFVTPQSQA